MSTHSHLGQIVADKEFTFRAAEVNSVGGSERARNFALAIVQEMAPLAQPALHAGIGALAGLATGDVSIAAAGALAGATNGILSGGKPRSR